MERPQLSQRYGDIQLYTVSRPLSAESAAHIQDVLVRLELMSKVAAVDYRPLGSATSWIAPRDTRDIFRDLEQDEPRRQKDAKPFNDIIFGRAERVEAQRPELPVEIESLDIFGSKTDGHERSSHFVVVTFSPHHNGGRALVDERNETINKLAYPTNASLGKYQKGVRPHLSLVLTDLRSDAELLKKDIKTLFGKKLGSLVFDAPQIDTVPYFCNPRAYQKYLRERRQVSRQRREEQLKLAQAA